MRARGSNIFKNHVFDAADVKDIHCSGLLFPAQLDQAQAPPLLTEQPGLSDKPLYDTTAIPFADDYVDDMDGAALGPEILTEASLETAWTWQGRSQNDGCRIAPQRFADAKPPCCDDEKNRKRKQA